MEGHWQNGKMHGQGRHIHASGDMEAGSFLKGQLEGEGCIVNTGLKTYDGMILNSVAHGYGKER